MTTQNITGIGFQVKWVWISRVLADNQAVQDKELIWTSDVIIDDDAAGLVHNITAAAVTTRHNAIHTLGSDGFSVDDDGAGADPNADGIVYNFVVMG